MRTLLGSFKKFAAKKGIADKIYIVGGAVRDIISGIGTKDIDVAVTGDALAISKEFAQVSGCSFVLLDSEFGISRVVKDSSFIDFSSLRDSPIASDLAGRDITINAMALPLCEWPSIFHVIDPFGGREDLSARIVRMLSESNLVSDPLRILRIYRFAASLHFEIEKNTRLALDKHGTLLGNVAVERIADELRCITSLADSNKIMTDMADDHVLAALFPEFAAAPGISIRKGVGCLKQCEHILCNASHYFPLNERRVFSYFDLPARRICLKLAALFSGTSHAAEAALRMKMSRKETGLVASFSSGCENIMFFCNTGTTGLELLRFLKNVQDGIYPSIILAAATAHMGEPASANETVLPEDRLPSFGNKVLSLYHDEVIPRMGLLRMITGDDLINEFGLPPSHRFKLILSALEDDILQKKVNTRDEALAKVREILKSAEGEKLRS
jgi:poly(A) polymerase